MWVIAPPFGSEVTYVDQTGERLGRTETDQKMSMSWVSSALVSASTLG